MWICVWCSAESPQKPELPPGRIITEGKRRKGGRNDPPTTPEPKAPPFAHTPARTLPDCDAVERIKG